MRTLAALAIVCALRAAASACTPDMGTCEGGLLVPEDGQTIPSPPALAWLPPSSQSALTAALSDGNGNPIAIDLVDDPAAPGFQLIVPRAPLAPGSYVVSANVDCPGPLDAGAAPSGTHHFTVEDAPPPTTVITPNVEETTLPLTVATSNGSCYDTIPAAVASYALPPSADLAPWMPLTRFTVTVDGAPWASSSYGEVDRNGNYPSYDARNITQLYAGCGVVPAGDDGGLAPGLHHVVIAPHIAGAKSDPPKITFDVDLECQFSGDDPPFANDLGVAPDDMPGDPILADHAGGCACAVGGRAGGEAPAVAVALLVLAFAVQRRRRR